MHAMRQNVQLLNGLTDLIHLVLAQSSTHASILLHVVTQMENSRSYPWRCAVPEQVRQCLMVDFESQTWMTGVLTLVVEFFLVSCLRSTRVLCCP